MPGGKARGQGLLEGGLVGGQAQAGQYGGPSLAEQKKIAQIARQFAHEKADAESRIEDGNRKQVFQSQNQGKTRHEQHTIR